MTTTPLAIGSDGSCRPITSPPTAIDAIGWPPGAYPFVVVQAPGGQSQSGWVLISGPDGVYPCNPTFFVAHFEVIDMFDDIVRRVMDVPPPTGEERRAWMVDRALAHIRPGAPDATRELVAQAFDRIAGMAARTVAPAPAVVSVVVAPPTPAPARPELPGGTTTSAGAVTDDQGAPKIDPDAVIRVPGGALLSFGAPSIDKLGVR